jgi:hypothetical protein
MSPAECDALLKSGRIFDLRASVFFTFSAKSRGGVRREFIRISSLAIWRDVCMACVSMNCLRKGPIMKNTVLSLLAIVALGTLGTTPVYAAGGGSGQGILCGIPFIGKFLCPPAPGGGGGGGHSSVPEPASLAILAAGAALAGAAARRRRTKSK